MMLDVKRTLYIPDEVFQWIFWLSVLVVAVLASLPGESIRLPEILIFWDKAQHFLAFFMLALLGSLAFSSRHVTLLVGLLLFGACIEVWQLFIPWRDADIFDFLADGVGVFLALAVGRLRVKS